MSADADGPVAYIARTHAWYRALGYETPYRYARFADVPYTPLRVPLAQARVALLTTAAPFRPELGPQGAGAPYNYEAKFYRVYEGDTSIDHDLRVSHVSVDRAEQSDDTNCWFPLPALRRAAAAGRIGGVTPRFLGVPTNRSQRHTIDVDVPEIVARVTADHADAAVLVPNCPVCHQTMSIVARALEAAGVATVVMGCARDIVEEAGVPRLLFSDLPLGNAAGLPWDTASQDAALSQALDLLETVTGPRTTAVSSLRWPHDRWKAAFMNPEGLSAEDRAAKRAEHEAGNAVGRAIRDA